MRLKSFPEKHGTTCRELRSICPKVDKTSVEFILSDCHNPLALSSKSQTLDRPTVRSQEQSVSVLEEIVKAFRQIVRGSEQTIRAFGQNLAPGSRGYFFFLSILMVRGEAEEKKWLIKP